jgi:hypothetical protein
LVLNSSTSHGSEAGFLVADLRGGTLVDRGGAIGIAARRGRFVENAPAAVVDDMPAKISTLID